MCRRISGIDSPLSGSDTVFWGASLGLDRHCFLEFIPNGIFQGVGWQSATSRLDSNLNVCEELPSAVHPRRCGICRLHKRCRPFCRWCGKRVGWYCCWIDFLHCCKECAMWEGYDKLLVALVTSTTNESGPTRSSTFSGKPLWVKLW